MTATQMSFPTTKQEAKVFPMVEKITLEKIISQQNSSKTNNAWLDIPTIYSLSISFLISLV